MSGSRCSESNMRLVMVVVKASVPTDSSRWDVVDVSPNCANRQQRGNRIVRGRAKNSWNMGAKGSAPRAAV